MIGLDSQTLGFALESAPTIRATGMVQSMRGLLVDGTLPGAQLGMLCDILIPGRPVPAEVVSVRENGVSLMPLKGVSGIAAGTEIRAGNTRPTVGVHREMLGRVLDGWGNPIDGKGPLTCIQRYPLEPDAINPMIRPRVTQAQHVGIRAIDTMLAVGRGQRLSIMAGSGVGKSTLLGMMARYSNADVKVIALIGERSREVRHFVDADLGVEGLRNSVVVAATSNMAAALRIRAAKTATAIAEFYRDQGLTVLLLMDSLTRVCMAQRELGLSTGEPPTTRGYPPSAFAIIPTLLERAGTGPIGGSITGFYTVFLEGDDQNDPIGDAVRAVTDGHIVLDRGLANRGRYPAIDILSSTSRVMSEVTSAEHRQAALVIRRSLADLQEAQELQELGAYEQGNVPRLDRAMKHQEGLRALLQQSLDEHCTHEDALSQLSSLVSAIMAEGANG
jgi:flagellum-specific ATP synthase